MNRTGSMSSFAITPQQLNDLVDFDKRADLARQRDLLAAQGGMEGLLRVLQTSAATGIITSPTETGRRQEVFGINKAPPPKSATFAELVWDAFQDRVLQILLVGAFITLAVGMWQNPKEGWHEGISIVLTVGIVVGCNCGNDYWKEKVRPPHTTRGDERGGEGRAREGERGSKGGGELTCGLVCVIVFCVIVL